jgi:hypothetical protein
MNYFVAQPKEVGHVCKRQRSGSPTPAVPTPAILLGILSKNFQYDFIRITDHNLVRRLCDCPRLGFVLDCWDNPGFEIVIEWLGRVSCGFVAGL